MPQPLINITRKHALTFAAFLVFYEFLVYVANDMIMPGMIKVVETFDGPESAVANSLMAYVFGGASLQVFLGPISDRYGRRPVMMFGVCLFFVCTVLITVSNSMDQFIAARFLQGMGLCFIGVIGYATLQEIFAEMDAIRLIAIMANVSILAPLLGPVLGAFFIYYYSWRFIFVMIGALALIALWGLWRYMPEPIGQIKRDGDEIKQTSLSFKVVTRNYKELCCNHKFILGSVALGLVSAPCLAWIALAPVILVANAKLSVIEYGIWQLPIFGAAISGNWVLQKLTRHYSAQKILAIGTSIVAISLLSIFLFPMIGGNSFLVLMPGIIVYFFGLGVTTGPLSRLTLFSTPIAKGTASALMTLISMCIQAVGIQVANILYQGHSNIIFGAFCAITGMIYVASYLSSIKTIKNLKVA